jgi:hypothetical protein
MSKYATAHLHFGDAPDLWCGVMWLVQLDEDEKIHAQKVILEQNFEKAEAGDDPDRKNKYISQGWTDNFSFTRHYFELLRGAQISLRKLEEYQVHQFP